ncbi:4-alpha-glucanotransferase [Thioalkalivibrio sp. XN8]|uniref:4-alpha-glucanotransferase n=1 Tax=Thioalkalivibrio sp. XN8 TaxID=2712863 RepID=UPI0013E9F652|nr:4-alpha-glucanotransferase [Thioalkalivibrio sp. XN8]NGP54661.1 4-alpha-glucanotransferase [Thioalkalivibrio sp. XN8]
MSEFSRELERLAGLAGIEPGFTDYRGRRHALGEAELAGLLEACGHDTTTAAAVRAAADRLEAEEWIRVLPPVVALQAGRPAEADTVMIAPMLPLVHWEIACEDGGRLAGSGEPGAWPLAGERELGGLWYQRRRLSLPALPAGYHRLRLSRADGGALGSTLLVVAPERCHLPPFLAAGERCWGLSVQLYGLRSGRNWGIGDFTDLAGLAAAAAGLGADLVGLNPLHALFPEEPGRCSPYSPSSRLFLNPMYIDPEAVPEFATATPVRRSVAAPGFQRQLQALRATPRVEYAAVAAGKFSILRALYDWFLAEASAARRQAFEDFRTEGGEALERFARQPGSGSAPPRPGEARWHAWLQWVARDQLAAAAAAARAAGMRIGLYLDLAVGPDPGGAEVRAEPDVFVTAAGVGAPPDPLAPQGQDWGIPPSHPRRLREREYAPFIRLLRANMPAGGALRIDHVMALLRLWWVPRGRSSGAGGYVRYRLDELMAIVALESTRRQCLVVGEDLGTVPDEVRAAMAKFGMLSYRVLMFEREADGSFRPPAAYPFQSLVTPTTHDLPTLAGYWEGKDLALRAALGLYPDSAVPPEELAAREEARQALLQAMGEEGLLEAGSLAPEAVPTAAFAASAQLFAARSHAAILMLQAEDWLGETTPVNVPGTHASYPNWRRKLGAPWPEFMAAPGLHTLAARVNAARAGNGPDGNLET